MKKKPFIEKANAIHNFKYNYDKVSEEFKTHVDKILITCHKHGDFNQTAHNHMQGQGCPLCGKELLSKSLKLTNKQFIDKSNKIHNNKYDYSKSTYYSGNEKVYIICPTHGEFWQTPNMHYKNGCSKCLIDDKMKIKKQNFINECNLIHDKKYNYDNVNYNGMYDKINIICPEHGEFMQLPVNHLYNKQGCPKCNCEVNNENDFIKKSLLVHNGKYKYDNVVYKTTNGKVNIICPIHGEFSQTPHHHLKGSGCPICNESKLEKKVCDFLDKNNVNYERQKKFNWLGMQSLDFYLTDYNIVIECQGEQHFKPVKYFGGNNRYIDTINRDLKKKILCENNKLNIFYIYDLEHKKYINNNDIVSEIYKDSVMVDIKNIYCFWKT